MKGGTTFHFVTDGIHAALERATEAARGKDVRRGGAPAEVRFGENTLDEMCLHYLWLRFKYDDFQAARAPQ